MGKFLPSKRKTCMRKKSHILREVENTTCFLKYEYFYYYRSTISQNFLYMNLVKNMKKWLEFVYFIGPLPISKYVKPPKK